jgi:NAD(P)-dependent dehydrogenase (short-subunit alcohol dehydrogenase family)
MLNYLITGTSQGIGLEFTRQVLEEGHRVLAVARPSSHLKNLHDLKEKYSDRLMIAEVDLKDESAIQMVSESAQSLNQVDVLINNAGIYGKDDSYQDFTTSFNTNSIVPYFLTQSLLSLLKKSRNPKVIFISSQMGSIADNSSGGAHSYRASKAAVNMIAKGIALDQRWLTSLVFHPGWVQTRMGGGGAPVAPADSVKGMLRIIAEASLSESGKFQSYQGRELPW